MKEEDIQNHIVKEYGHTYEVEHLKTYASFINISYNKAKRCEEKYGIDVISYMNGCIDGMKALAYLIGQVPKEAEELAFCLDSITNGKTLEECCSLSDKIVKDSVLFPKVDMSKQSNNISNTQVYIENLWKKYQEYKETAEQSMFPQLVLYDAILEPSYKDLQEHWSDEHAKTFIKGMEDIVFNKLGIK